MKTGRLRLLLIAAGSFVAVGLSDVATGQQTSPQNASQRQENKKNDFVGARSLRRPEDQRTDRRQLIGFEVEKGTVLPGAHIVTGNGAGYRSEGFVTSAFASPILGKTIGLGLLERGFERKGEQVQLFDDGHVVAARIVDACFYDPDGERMRG